MVAFLASNWPAIVLGVLVLGAGMVIAGRFGEASRRASRERLAAASPTAVPTAVTEPVAPDAPALAPITSDRQRVLRKSEAMRNLRAIRDALERYADARKDLPPYLTPSLDELRPYGLTPQFELFEGGALASYRLDSDPKFRYRIGLLEAKVMGTGQTIRLAVMYPRQRYGDEPIYLLAR